MTGHIHTPGPLRVRMDDRWPFDIVTVDAGGNKVFRRRLPSHSSSDRTAADAIAGVHLPEKYRDEWAAENSRAVADEVLRAAAPDMLVALGAARKWIEIATRNLGLPSAETLRVIDQAMANATRGVL